MSFGLQNSTVLKPRKQDKVKQTRDPRASGAGATSERRKGKRWKKAPLAATEGQFLFYYKLFLLTLYYYFFKRKIIIHYNLNKYNPNIIAIKV